MDNATEELKTAFVAFVCSLWNLVVVLFSFVVETEYHRCCQAVGLVVAGGLVGFGLCGIWWDATKKFYHNSFKRLHSISEPFSLVAFHVCCILLSMGGIFIILELCPGWIVHLVPSLKWGWLSAIAIFAPSCAAVAPVAVSKVSHACITSNMSSPCKRSENTTPRVSVALSPSVTTSAPSSLEEVSTVVALAGQKEACPDYQHKQVLYFWALVCALQVIEDIFIYLPVTPYCVHTSVAVVFLWNCLALVLRPQALEGVASVWCVPAASTSAFLPFLMARVREGVSSCFWCSIVENSVKKTLAWIDVKDSSKLILAGQAKNIRSFAVPATLLFLPFVDRVAVVLIHIVYPLSLISKAMEGVTKDEAEEIFQHCVLHSMLSAVVSLFWPIHFWFPLSRLIISLLFGSLFVNPVLTWCHSTVVVAVEKWVETVVVAVEKWVVEKEQHLK